MSDPLRTAEALLFAAARPLTATALAERLPPGTDVEAVLEALARRHGAGGFVLAERGGAWAFQTAPDLAHLLVHERTDTRPLGRAAMEVLAIIAYHEPATRAEIEEVRGTAVARDTLGVLIATGWVKLAGRRVSPGRPVQYATTPAFLRAFDLGHRRDLPDLAELEAAGLLDPEPPGAPALPWIAATPSG